MTKRVARLSQPDLYAEYMLASQGYEVQDTSFEVLEPVSSYTLGLNPVGVDCWSVQQVSNTLSYTIENVQALVSQVPVTWQEQDNQISSYRELLAFTLTDLVGILPDEVQAQVKTILAAHDVLVYRVLEG